MLAFPPNIISYKYRQDVASEISAELQCYPDFIIGNYSDGNLVASLLAYKMGVTQVFVPLFCHLISILNLKACVIFCRKCNLIELNVVCVVHNRTCTGEDKISRFGYILEEI